MPRAPKPRRQQLTDMARGEARTMKTLTQTGPKTIPESQQLTEFDRRAAQGIDGFKDLYEQHGPKGLADYWHAMGKLRRRLKKGP